MPPESSAGYFSSNSARPTERSRSRAFLRWVSLSSLLISTGSMTLLNTVRQSSSTSRWNTMPALPPAPFTGTPPTVIVPVVRDQARYQHHHRALAAAAGPDDRDEL